MVRNFWPPSAEIASSTIFFAFASDWPKQRLPNASVNARNFMGLLLLGWRGAWWRGKAGRGDSGGGRFLTDFFFCHAAIDLVFGDFGVRDVFSVLRQRRFERHLHAGNVAPV